jgi:hypothetical protein
MYIPRIEQRENNLFLEEYYSSTDVRIFMDGIEQTEIAYINYSLQEQLKPIYGYASRTFDDVAIGNRIVTGMFKVPIKNPEAQHSLKEVLDNEKGVTSDIDDYNEDQQNLKDSIEWIDEIPTDTVFTEDDDTFEYRTKLISLGYDLDSNSSEHVLRQQIKNFQQDNNLEVNGKLNNLTKIAIDKALSTSELPTIKLPKNTPLYTKPMFGSKAGTLDSEQEVYILDKYDDGWLYIMTQDGTERYVNTQEVS